jgi:hypothetical protein
MLQEIILVEVSGTLLTSNHLATINNFNLWMNYYEQTR